MIALPHKIIRRVKRILFGPQVSQNRGDLLAGLPKGGVCAEIGTWRGDFAADILRIKQPARLYLVDPWRFVSGFPNRWYGGKVAKSQADMDEIAAIVERRFGGDGRITICRMTSAEFFASHSDVRFDWIYIDGDHSFDAKLADLTLAWPLLAPGGRLSGDDYTRLEGGRQQVREAVDAFAARVGAQPIVDGEQFSFIGP